MRYLEFPKLDDFLMKVQIGEIEFKSEQFMDARNMRMTNSWTYYDIYIFEKIRKNLQISKMHTWGLQQRNDLLMALSIAFSGFIDWQFSVLISQITIRSITQQDLEQMYLCMYVSMYIYVCKNVNISSS